MSRIAVVGAGYVGLVTAAAMAKLGHDVTCVDVDLEKVASIKANRLPIEEPDLEPLWQQHQERSTLRMTADYAEAARGAEFVFLCVGTPPGRNGSVNLLHLISATAATMESLAPEERPILVIKSTVPVGAAELVTAILAQFRSPADRPPVVSNPEFLRKATPWRTSCTPRGSSSALPTRQRPNVWPSSTPRWTLPSSSATRARQS